MVMSKIVPIVIAATLVLVSVYAAAQEEAPAAENTEADPLSAARAKGGDILIMNSGAIMSGVQILKSTTRTYEIQVVEGAEPIIIPRRQVESVELDDIEPLREARRKANRSSEQDQLMTDGREVSAELRQRLKAPIPNSPLEFDKTDYVTVFNQITNATQVQIVIDPSLADAPPETRQWTITIPAEMRLMDLLQMEWLAAFEDGKILYALDKVILHKKGVEPKNIPEPPPTEEAAPPPSGINLRQD